MQKFTLILLIFVFVNIFSQEILIPVNDSLCQKFDVVIKHNGNSLNYYETAYYKQDTTKIAWKKLVVNGKISGVYKEYFPNEKLYKKIVYDLQGNKNGIYQEWDKKGNLCIYGQYKNNLKTGTWQFHKAKRFEVYRKGKKHGRWRIYEGKTPWTLYVYKKDFLVRVKK